MNFQNYNIAKLLHVKLNLLLICLAQTFFAQSTFSGNIKDKNGISVQNANLVFENPVTGDNLDYIITDEKGYFNIKLMSEIISIRLTITAFNFKSKIVLLENKNQLISETLQSDFTQLQEVKIESKIVERRNDTITYNLKSYEGKEDRTLADVLRKIPGLTVDEAGKIEYQGNPINKFYVEGKDLMTGAYGTLNNALPKDAVTKIQVLENHQPIKVLKDLLPSNQAGINVKLKKNITLTGRSEIGLGTNIGFLRKVNIVPMVFTKNYQYLVNLKSNNIGIDSSVELETINFSDILEGLVLQNATGNWLRLFEIAKPQLQQKRFIFNDINLISANFLTAINKNWELSAKTSVFNSKINRQEFERTSVIILNDIGQNSEILFTRNNDLNFSNKQSNSELILTKNTKTTFIKNTFQIQSNDKTDVSQTFLNNKQLSQDLTSPGFSIQNSFSGIFSINKKLINFKSNVNFINDKQEYVISPTSSIKSDLIPLNLVENLVQNFDNKNFGIYHDASVIFNYKKLIFTPSVAFNHEIINSKTALFGISNDNQQIEFGSSFINNLNWEKNNFILSFGTVFNGENLNVLLNLPLNFNAINVNNVANQTQIKNNLILLQPSITLKYDFNAQLKSIFVANSDRDFGTIDNHYTNLYFSSLNTARQNGIFNNNKSYKLGNDLVYKLIEDNMDFVLGYKYSKVISNNLNTTNFLENGQIATELVEFQNETKNNRLIFNASKSLPRSKTKISINHNIILSTALIKLNGTASQLRNNTNETRISAVSNYFTWLTFTYDFNFLTSKRSNDINILNSRNNIELLFFPIENHSIGITTEYNYYKNNNVSTTNNFLDIQYMFSLKKRKIDIGFEWQNAANRKSYSQIIVSDFSTTFATYQLRPSQILLYCNFNF